MWKVRTGIHEIKESHRRQLDAEKKYLEASLSPTDPEYGNGSPSTPISPVSPLPSINRLSASAMSLQKTPHSPLANKNDDAILESFFGSDQINKLNAFKSSISIDEAGQETREQKSQSTDKLDSKLPKDVWTQKSKAAFISKEHYIHASSPDLTIKRKNEPVGDIKSEMQELRMRLRQTANQAVAEIDEKFSPKFERLRLGPSILAGDRLSGHSYHSHQGSLDSSPQLPRLAQVSSSAAGGHSRQYSLPANVAASTRPYSPVKLASPPLKPPSPSQIPEYYHQHSRSKSPNQQGSYSSGLARSNYHTQSAEALPFAGNGKYMLPKQSSMLPLSSGSSITGMHRKPPPASRQYSPSGQGNIGLSGNVYGSRRYEPVSNNGRRVGMVQQYSLDESQFYSSNHNRLAKDSTHYSTTVIKKRRSDGKINPPHIPNNLQSSRNSYTEDSGVSSSHTPPDYDHLDSPGAVHQTQHTRNFHHPYSASQVHTSHSPPPLQTSGEFMCQHAPNYSNRDTSVEKTHLLDDIQPYGEIRAGTKHFQYVPYTDQRKAASVAMEQNRSIHRQVPVPENTWC